MRTSTVKRKTKETNINISISMDSKLESKIDTKVPFLNHMLEAFSFYAGISLTIAATGDIEIDDHHTVEDIGIVLGQAIKEISQQQSVNRFGTSYIPMDESLSRVVIDLSNRPFLYYDVSFSMAAIGGLSLCNVEEFFRAFVNESRMTLHISNLYGKNDHHKVESIFKAFGKALKESLLLSNSLQSTKGIL